MKITVIMPATRMKRIKVRRDKKSGMTYETLDRNVIIDEIIV